MREFTRIGFVVPDLGHSQLSYYLIRNLNAMLGQHLDICPVVFYENLLRPPITPAFATMHVCCAYASEMPLVATSLETARKILAMPAPKRAFYLWDVEWLRSWPREDRPYRDVYRSRKLSLIARSPDHASLVSKAWNVDIAGISENFALEPIFQNVLADRRDML